VLASASRSSGWCLVDRGTVNFGHDPALLKELLRSLQSARFDPVLF
jgi:hypothetical protein